MPRRRYRKKRKTSKGTTTVVTYRSSVPIYRGLDKGSMSGGMRANGVAYVKLKGLANIDASSGNITHAFRLTEPQIFDGVNPVQDWTFLLNMYDFFKVRYVKIKFIPSKPNDLSSTTVYRPLYVFTDPNSTTLSPSNVQAIQYDGVAVKDMSRPWKYFYKCVNYQGTGVAPRTFYPMDAPPATGAIYLTNTGSTLTNGNYGVVLVTYYILAKSRR